MQCRGYRNCWKSQKENIIGKILGKSIFVMRHMDGIDLIPDLPFLYIMGRKIQNVTMSIMHRCLYVMQRMDDCICMI